MPTLPYLGLDISSAPQMTLTPAPAALSQVTQNITNILFTTSAPNPETGANNEPDPNILNYQDFLPRLLALEQDWSEEFALTRMRRDIRMIKVDVETLRRTDRIAVDETLIPIRLADTNIRREQPPYIAYLKQSRRSAVFKCITDSKVNTSLLEEEFTRTFRYDGWEIPQFKVLDGSMAHGWDSVEICFDERMPGRYCFKHIGHDKLLFARDAVDLQACEFIVVTYDISESRLKSFVKKYGFNQQQVDMIIPIQNTADRRLERIYQIRKLFYRSQDGSDTIYVAWYFPTQCDDWLLAPKPCYLGVQKEVTKMVVSSQLNSMTGAIEQVPTPQQSWEPVYETSFPVEILPYYEIEEARIIDHRGRVFFDQYKQEALTTLWSSFVNGCTRASNVYASPTNNSPVSGGAPKLTTTQLVNGGIYSEPLNFWSLPYPDAMLLKATEGLETQNAAETNQIAWAVNNREDSRKTAEEIKSANEQAALINGVQVTLYSIFQRRLCNRAWRIIQSNALQGKIIFMPVDDGNPEHQEMRIYILQQDYDVKAAGDTDFVERSEKLARMGQFWPIVQQTAAGPVFLADMLKTAFPDDGGKYAEILMQGDQKMKAIQVLGSITKGLLEQFGNQIPPQQLKQVDGLMQQVSSGVNEQNQQEAQ